jgi:hypothetical protein
MARGGVADLELWVSGQSKPLYRSTVTSELVSGSIPSQPQFVFSAPWMLKQVQHDDRF